ncbi:hypothetical protein CpipJ_CPIJ001902, partial [Culex quinquefasciatus]
RSTNAFFYVGLKFVSRVTFQFSRFNVDTEFLSKAVSSSPLLFLSIEQQCVTINRNNIYDNKK